MSTVSSYKLMQTSFTTPLTISFLPTLTTLLSASESFYHLPIHVNDSNNITLSCYPYHVVSKLLSTSIISVNPHNHPVRHISIPIIQKEKPRFGEMQGLPKVPLGVPRLCDSQSNGIPSMSFPCP